MSTRMAEIPVFDQQQTSEIQKEESEVSAPSFPKENSDVHSLDEKLNQIITISEIFQPSEDDLAERILSQSEEPFNINFDLNDGVFTIDFDILPDDNRSQFKAKCDFT